MIKPQEVTDVDIAFGGRSDELLPAWNDIPDEFKNGNTKWHRLAHEIFYNTLSQAELHERGGVDVHLAARHIRAVLDSFQPKHEHKMAGVAYLLSNFYQDVVFDTAEPPSK